MVNSICGRDLLALALRKPGDQLSISRQPGNAGMPDLGTPLMSRGGGSIYLLNFQAGGST